jgi:hypothetical protein
MDKNDVEERLLNGRPPVENERGILAFCVICVIITLALCAGGLFLINYLFDKKTWI